jgi:hypothetical protein
MDQNDAEAGEPKGFNNCMEGIKKGLLSID